MLKKIFIMGVLSVTTVSANAATANFIYCAIGRTELIATANINQVNFKSVVTVYRNSLERNDEFSGTQVNVRNPKIIGSVFTMTYDSEDKMFTACTSISGAVAN